MKTINTSSVTIHVGRGIGPLTVDLDAVHPDTIVRALTRGLRDMVNDAGADPKTGAAGCHKMYDKILAGVAIGGGADPSRGRTVADPWMKVFKEMATERARAKGQTTKAIAKVLEKYPNRVAVETAKPDFALEVQAEFEIREAKRAALALDGFDL